MGTSPANSLNNKIEATDAGSIRVDVRKSDELIDDLLLSSPIVREAAKVRNDEVNVRVLGREQLYQIGSPDDVHEHRNAELAHRVAYFPVRGSIIAMHLQPPQT